MQLLPTSSLHCCGSRKAGLLAVVSTKRRSPLPFTSKHAHRCHSPTAAIRKKNNEEDHRKAENKRGREREPFHVIHTNAPLKNKKKKKTDYIGVTRETEEKTKYRKSTSSLFFFFFNCFRPLTSSAP